MNSCSRTSVVAWNGWRNQSGGEAVFKLSNATITSNSTTLQLWSWPTHPWSRLHVDYAGPIAGNMFLIVIDAHSKWIVAFQMSTATASTTIQRLRQLFAQFGIPESIISDNGPQFVAAEFQDFSQLNGIKHTRVAPYHSSSNGLAERAMKIFQQGLKKQSGGSFTDQVAHMLF